MITWSCTHTDIHTYEKQEQSVRENIAAHQDNKGYATEKSFGTTSQIKNYQTYVLVIELLRDSIYYLIFYFEQKRKLEIYKVTKILIDTECIARTIVMYEFINNVSNVMKISTSSKKLDVFNVQCFNDKLLKPVFVVQWSLVDC